MDRNVHSNSMTNLHIFIIVDYKKMADNHVEPMIYTKLYC